MPAEFKLNLKTKSELDEEDAAARIQAIKRGNDDRAKVEAAKARQSSPIWGAVRANEAAKLEEVLEAAEAGSMALADPVLGTPLQVAVVDAKYDCAKALIKYDSALGVPATDLAVWQKVQKDMLPGVGEDGEPTDPIDTTTDEYQAELAAALFPGTDATEAGYRIKHILRIGLYVGAREVVPEHEQSFDSQVGNRAGYGVTLSPSGDVYAGNYGAGGLRDGAGALRTKDGTVYAGQWAVGKRHGSGTMVYKDGGVYTGAWAYGKRHGVGRFTYATGDTYNGAWHAGNKHGEGKYNAKAAGCVYEGTWKHGSLVASKVVFTTAANAAYYGRFTKDGRPTGHGAFSYGSGVTLTGSYLAPPPAEDVGDEPVPLLPAVWNGDKCGAVEGTTDSTFKAELMTVPPSRNVIIAGAPASGKGTQCEKIVAKYGLVHISTGDMLRAAAADPDNEVGQIAKEKMEAGELVPDELITALLVAKLDSDEVRDKGFLLDGYPRTAIQAADLEKHFILPNKCILLDVPDEVLVARVCGRRLDPETGTIYHLETKPPYKLDAEGVPVEEVDDEGNPTGKKALDEEIVARLTQRGDDTEDALKNRLVNFAANRDAVAATFSSIAITVDGNRNPDVVWEEIDAFIGK